MDFVVVGFGLGALGVLLGVVLLGRLAPRAHRAAARAATPDDAAHDRAIAAQHRGAGQTFLYAGAAMLLATVGGLAGSLDDRTGAFLVTTTATVAAIGILLGGHLHRVRYPVPPRRRTRPAPATSTAHVPVNPPVKAAFLLADDAPTGATEHDAEDASVAPHLRADPGARADVESTAPALPTVDGEPAEGAIEADAPDDGPGGAAAIGLEGRKPADFSESHGGDDPVLAQEEKTVAASAVPAARPADAPPPRRDAEDDPS